MGSAPWSAAMLSQRSSTSLMRSSTVNCCNFVSMGQSLVFRHTHRIRRSCPEATAPFCWVSGIWDTVHNTVSLPLKSIKKPAFYAGLVEVLGRFRMLSDDLNGGAGGNRTPVHKSYATRSTYVATSIVLTAHYPTGRESAQPAR